MKLATLRTGARDGELIVVNRQLTRAVKVPHLALTLQAALDKWSTVEDKLRATYKKLNTGGCAEDFALDALTLESPLPRAYQWADGSAYVNHMELVRKARGVEMPENFWTDPLMYQGGSDAFLGPKDPILVANEAWGIDFEAEVGVIVNDVRMGITPDEAKASILLVLLINDVSLRNLIPAELGKGFGFFQSKPSSAFSPVAVTPDELGAAWDGGKIHLPLITHFNEKPFGMPNAGVDMTFDFPSLIAHAAKTRPLSAGAIIGSGTVSNVDRSKGSSCLAERRMLEIIKDGKATTEFMHFGDRVRIEMFDEENQSIFGAIDQTVECYND